MNTHSPNGSGFGLRSLSGVAILMLLTSCSAAPPPRVPQDEGGGDDDPIANPAPEEHDCPQRGHAAAGAQVEVIGLDGIALARANYLYMATHEGYPASTADLQVYAPFEKTFDDLEIGVSTNPEGITMLTAERDMSEVVVEKLTADFAGLEPPEWIAGYDPPLGIDGQTERYLVWPDMGANDFLTDQYPQYTQLYGYLGMSSMQDPTVSYPAGMTPDPCPENAKLGYLLNVIHEAFIEIAMCSEDHLGPSTLTELAGYYGGMNATAWTNPFTGLPMQNVPLGSPSIGDYTEVLDGEANLLAFHYKGTDGQPYTAVVFDGQRAEYTGSSFFEDLAAEGEGQ